MQVTKVAPLECPECKSKNVNQRNVMKGYKKIVNRILSCFDCKKDYSERDNEATEHKNRPFYGRGGTREARCQMGDYLDHRGI